MFWEKTTDVRNPPESFAGDKMPNGKVKSTPRNRDDMLRYSETNRNGHTVPVWSSAKNNNKRRNKTMQEYVSVEKVRIAIMEEINSRYTWDCGDRNDFLQEDEKERRNRYYKYFMKLVATAKPPIE